MCLEGTRIGNLYGISTTIADRILSGLETYELVVEINNSNRYFWYLCSHFISKIFTIR